ncbi:FadR/GntR family transcriptional regulator [Alteribacillus iranensis]|uniref:DNA-binding transcriptional regulator, FadR family n=1 Tax=Alteribacillus iranensis TaxID=930128 RepID=A0A1I2BC94_9BACI|nr:FCD domain-containing protein [Alteribacillus iranensis]SFE53771.1 DNA-binding transcriptional regulator, FadR family [Alteribacillus iranensis]
MKKTQYQKMLENMTEQILRGNWAKGEKLPILPELSEKYNVSVSTAREVLKVLESRGFVRIQQGSGTFVSSTLPESEENASHSKIYNILRLIEYRIIIEPEFAKSAATIAYQEEIDAIYNSAITMLELIKSNSPIIEEDLNFHTLIAKATHNNYALSSYMNLQTELRESRVVLRQGREHQNIFGMKERAANYHMLIAESIKARKAEEAKEYMYKHLQCSYELAMNNLSGHIYSAY